jgi:nitrogen fixation/metabolism regulation signal transduction histidine kinase
MTARKLRNNLPLQLLLLAATTAAATAAATAHNTWLAAAAAIAATATAARITQLYKRNAQKIALMFDAIENADHTFRYTEHTSTNTDQLVNHSLNRIMRILHQTQAGIIQKEKYYEHILNSVNTGIIVLDNRGYIHQTNREAHRLLGLPVLTHLKQLRTLGDNIEETLATLHPGHHHQITLTNERGTAQLSIRAAQMTLHNQTLRILAINDIHHELDNREIDSWIRLTRVLTHEIMNAITPLTSLSDTLLTHPGASPEIRTGLETISTTGKSLITFVESYHQFTHIPPPRPTLFYLQRFADRMIQLARHHNPCPRITFTTDIQPDNLIIHADENLAGQVVLNLLKNAVQAIGTRQPDGRIEIKARCTDSEAILIEITNNGPPIPPEEAQHIFVPFFTTKEGGSGIGLSISRQIMRLTGGSITLKNTPHTHTTTFVLTFP